MHYDFETGAKNSMGLFSKLTVITLAFLIVAIGAYLAVDWFAPEIFIPSAAEKSAIENKVKNDSPNQNYNVLRIPSIGVDREVVPKNVEDKIQITMHGNRIVLSGKARIWGVTPFDTLRLSPLAILGSIKSEAQIFVDLAGVRTVYKTINVDSNTTPNSNPDCDLTIYALSEDGKTALTQVRADTVGEVKVP